MADRCHRHHHHPGRLCRHPAAPRPLAPGQTIRAFRANKRPKRPRQNSAAFGRKTMLNRRSLLGALSAVAMLAATSGATIAQDSLDIALISKGFQHQFWQAVKAGADKAAAEFGANVTFEGPDTETQVDRQMDMLAAALSRQPDAIG